MSNPTLESLSEDSSHTSSDGTEPDTLLADSAALYNSKNDDYGEAWRLAGETMAMWARENDIDIVDPKDPAQMVSLNLYVQRLHKLVRAFNLEFSESDPDNEDVSESHQDAGVYAHLHASHLLEESEDT